MLYNLWCTALYLHYWRVYT